ncbi:unnamed protein product [Euphydryas editha]|uniref:Uncharacterized protein n=1 Tax=Euphydryas editha TaxID=104508 RepID=A0AAU9UPU7_EUPED|nr:unnamed protein product [Euphydryas editha]
MILLYKNFVSAVITNYAASTPPKPSSAPAHTTLQRSVRAAGPARVIPRFHFPKGRPPPAHQQDHALHKVQSAFATFPNSQILYFSRLLNLKINDVNDIIKADRNPVSKKTPPGTRSLQANFGSHPKSNIPQPCYSRCPYILLECVKCTSLNECEDIFEPSTLIGTYQRCRSGRD